MISSRRRRNLALEVLLAASLLLGFERLTARAAADEKTRTVQYLETSGSTNDGPNYVMQVLILDGNLQRTTVKPRPKDGRFADQNITPDADDLYEILDARQGCRVRVYPGKREFVRVTGFRRSSGMGQIETIPIKVDANANFDEFLRRPVPSTATEQLPEQLIDGRRAVGFREVEKTDTGTHEDTYWVDPVSRLPVRIERWWRPADPGQPDAKLVRHNIIFDAPFERSLFRTEPPAGYQVLPDAEY